MASNHLPKQLQANQQTGEATQKLAPQSSFIEAAEYDAAKMSLTVTFKKGGQQQHFFVYPAEWQQAILSPSLGVWYNKNLRGKKLSAKILDANTGEKHDARHGR